MQQAVRAKILVGLIPFAGLMPVAALADPATFFNTIPLGRTEFQNRVSNAGGTYQTDALSGLTTGATSWTRTDYTITPSNGVGRSVTTSALNPAPTSLPGGDAIRMTADGTTSSGLTFTFTNPINGFGLDLDDWATCCFPSSLYISFDGGTPILVGTANSSSDNPGTAAGQGAKTFIGAIDDSNTFSVITFYGTGSGDVLNAGGIIYYANVPLGSISGNYVTAVASGTTVSKLATYFDEFDGSGTRQTLANHLNTLSAAQVAEVLKTVFPVNTAQAAQTGMGAGQQTASVLIEKVGTVLGSVGGNATPFDALRGDTRSREFDLGTADGIAAFTAHQNSAQPYVAGDALSHFASQPFTKFKLGQQALWFQGVGAGARGEATSRGLAYRSQSAGVVGGYEYAISPDALIGILASVFHTDVKMDSNAGDTEAVNYNVGLYGQRLLNDMKLTGIVAVNSGRYDSTRIINSGGVFAAPQATYNGRGLTATAGISKLFEDTAGVQAEPFAQVSFGLAQTEEYTEHNGGSFNTKVSGDEIATASLKAGVTMHYDAKLWNAQPLTVKFKPYVGQQFELDGSKNDVRFVGANTATVVNGQSLNVFQVGTALETLMDIGETQNIKLGMDLSADKFESRYLGYVGWGVKF